MYPTIYPIAQALPGDLILMPKPSADWLNDDLHWLRNQGVTTLVSLLEHNEACLLGLADEELSAKRNGLLFAQFPVQDRAAPELDRFALLVADLVHRIQAGQTVAIHCRAGIGRSGMTVSAILLHFGWNATSALAHVSEIRTVTVPDTTQQQELVMQYAAALDCVDDE